jgi:hypothetical protein
MGSSRTRLARERQASGNITGTVATGIHGARLLLVTRREGGPPWQPGRFPHLGCSALPLNYPGSRRKSRA